MKNLLCVFLLVTSFAFAQKGKSIQIGQTTVDELKMSSYPLDSSAAAVVLYEQTNFYMSNSVKPRFTIDNYHRIKILTKEGLDEGTLRFGLYKKDKIIEINGATYNLDENNSVVSVSIREEDILRKKINDNFDEIIINLPQVKVGSVLEFQYSVSSLNLNIDDWYFQSSILKIKSVVHTMVPKYLEHFALLRGQLKLSDIESKEKTKCFPKKKRFERCNYVKYVMDSVPKFEEEPLMPDPNAYIAKLDFTIARINRPGYYPYKMKSSWQEFDGAYQKYLLKDEKRKQSFYKKKVPDSLKTGANKLEIAKQLYYFIQEHYTWNRYKGGDTRYRFSKRSQKKSGSVDLIATSLYNSLKASGIEVYYVLVGTRGYGIPNKTLPSLSSFNYTVLKVIIDNEVYYLDAANKQLAFGELSPMVLNFSARVIDFEKGGYWEKLAPKHISKYSSVMNVSFDEDMNLKGRLLIRKEGISGYLARNRYKELGKEKYLEKVEERLTKVELDSFTFKNSKALEKPAVESYDIFVDSEDLNTVTNTEDRIVFSPVFFDQLTENPFKSDNRKYELDFVYHRNNSSRLLLKIPTNYKVVKLPKSIGLELPNNAGSYTYKIFQAGNKISIQIKFSIQKDLFSVKEYYYLKELYEKIIQAEDAHIELQKIEE